MLTQKITNLLENSLENPKVIISDPREDGMHLQAIIISSSFDNLSLLERHRKVKQSLKELFAEGLHALSIKTYSRDEWKLKEQEL